MNKTNKTIVAIGGGIQRKNQTQRIDDYILKLSKKEKPNILFINTASRYRKDYEESFRGSIKKINADASIETIFKKISPKKIRERLSNIDMVYIGGGDPKNFNKDQDFKKYIKEILKYKKSIILSGLSAGCAIWFTEIIYIERGEIKKIKGLNQVSGSCIPHSNQYKLKEKEAINQTNNKRKFFIEDKTAFVFKKNKLINKIK
jgi:peptidase E